ncbi:hypothetical protein A2592_02725 [Candidatus Kaiserbacteria bacterium RIFOXYD1_FULL_42_15]|uniref:Uncharacterized protein n=1 Tax=Candidatus Kaiserbacteria bacterium RIFOXYD1_FULL_42_15 TaxID=1798532 RepID=A0A1F6FSD8_9BACT|nr:MAG: hypothetical protein A2592_02725 [Candidatus Kaiserbacteria bacterium RIFOXYD1_FULL_42_15]
MEIILAGILLVAFIVSFIVGHWLWPEQKEVFDSEVDVQDDIHLTAVKPPPKVIYDPTQGSS